MSFEHKKPVIAGALAGAAVFSIAAVMISSQTDQIAKSQIIEHFESQGFDVELDGATGSFDGSFTASGLALSKEGVKTNIQSLESDGQYHELEGMSITHVPEAVTIDIGSASLQGVNIEGEDEVSFGDDVAFNVSDVEVAEGSVNGQDLSGRTGGLSVNWTYDESNQLFDGDFTVSLTQTGEMTGDFALSDFDKDALEKASNNQTAPEKLPSLKSAKAKFANEGGFETYIQHMAKQQNIEPEDAQKFLAAGVNSSAIPQKYKQPLIEFVENPEVLSVSSEPREPVGFNSLKQSFQLTMTGRQPFQTLLDDINFQVRSNF